MIDDKIEIITELINICIKFLDIKNEIDPGIISIAIPNIIPLDFIEATIASDKIARKT